MTKCHSTLYAGLVNCALFSCFVFSPQLLLAEDSLKVNVGVDIANRYIFRGIDFGASASIQPSIRLNIGGFTLGGWGAYSLGPASFAADEIDLYIQYAFKSDIGTFTPIITDYYYPNVVDEAFPEKGDLFNFDGDGEGSHLVEAGLIYTGPDALPIELMAMVNFHNDPDNSMYFQAGYNTSIASTKLGFFVGAATGSSIVYGIAEDGIELINIGVRASKDLVISEDVTIPLSVSYIINANAELSYLVVMLSL